MPLLCPVPIPCPIPILAHNSWPLNVYNAAVSVCVLACIDLDTRGLECRPLQWHGEDEPLGGPLLRGPHDVWQLRPLQSTRRHSRRRFLRRGTLAQIYGSPVYWWAHPAGPYPHAFTFGLSIDFLSSLRTNKRETITVTISKLLSKRTNKFNWFRFHLAWRDYIN